MKATFEIGQKYQMTFIGDSELRPVWKCTARTDKTAKFENRGETISKKIRVYNDEEYVLYGNYSMAPCINSKRIAI